MALGTGIEIPNNFDLNSPLPLDARFIAADPTERDALDSVARYEGLLVYVVSEAIMYQLQGGITNANWAVAGGGGGSATPIVDLATGDGFIVAFTLTEDPVVKENVAVYIDGVRQSTTTYDIVTGDVEFLVAPYDGATLMFVTGAVTAVNVPIDGSVSTAKIQDDAVTTVKIPDGAITTPKIADDAVTTAKIDDGAVTKIKLGTLGEQVSASSGTFNTGSFTYVDVTNLSVTFTSVAGRPNAIKLKSDGSGNISKLSVRSITNTTVIYGDIRILRDATTIFESRIEMTSISSGTGFLVGVPVSSVVHDDIVGAGTYVYKVQAKAGADSRIDFSYIKLQVYET